MRSVVCILGLLVWPALAGHLAQSPGDPQTIDLSHARQAVDAPPLRLEDAVREALDRNPGVEAAERRVDPLRSRPAQVASLQPPILQAQIWQWPINTLNPANTNMYMLMATQELPRQGKRTALTTLANAETRVAETAIDVSKRDVVEAVSASYWDLFLARRATSIHLASADLLHRLTDAAEAKYGAGRASQQDVLRPTVEATKLHNDLLDFDRDAAQAAYRLNALMNRPLDAPIGRLGAPSESTLTSSLEDLQAQADRDQPDLRASRAEVDHAHAQLEVARTAKTPDWSVGGGYMLLPRQTDAWLGNVSVSWPGAPWARRGLDARTAEATAAKSAAESDVAAVVNRVRMAVADAYARIKTAEARAALIRTTLLPQARQAFAASTSAYEADRGDVLSVIESERTLLDAQLSYDRALVEWRIALVALERAIGSPVSPATVRVVNAEVAR